MDGLEKQVDRNVGTTTIPVTLEEIATGARVAYAAENSGGKIVFIVLKGTDAVAWASIPSLLVAWSLLGLGSVIVFIGCQVGGSTPPDNPMPSSSHP